MVNDLTSTPTMPSLVLEILFGAATNVLLFIGARNKYSSVCTIIEQKNSTTPSYQCYGVVWYVPWKQIAIIANGDYHDGVTTITG